MESPRVVVIVVSFNSRVHFPRLRASLEAQKARFDLIVFDNASEPVQKPTLNDFPARALILQSERNLGFAAANNRAASLVKAPYIALLNPDAFPEPDWLSRLLAAAERHPRAGVIGSMQLSAEDPSQYDGLGDCYHASGLAWRGGYGHPLTVEPPQGEPFSACAAAALYRAEAWREAGGFDESFFCYCEDVDLGFRLRLLGWGVAQAQDAVVAHVGGASSGRRSPFAVVHGTRNRTWTFVKNMPGALFWLLAPAHVAMVLALLLISPLRGVGAPTWRGLCAALAGLGPVWRERRRVQAARKASLGEIAAALTWSPTPALKRAAALKRPQR